MWISPLTPTLSQEEAEVTGLTEVDGWMDPHWTSSAWPKLMPTCDIAPQHTLPKWLSVGCRQIKQGLSSLVWEVAKIDLVRRAHSCQSVVTQVKQVPPESKLYL